jgi:hypothetical protein
MPAEHLDMTRANGLHIEQGADWDYTMVYAADADASGNPISPINLTGFTARMALKVAKNAPDPPIIALTTTNGRIVLGGTAGTIHLHIVASDTSSIPAVPTDSTYYYDLELVNPAGFVERLLEGQVVVTEEVTTVGS